MAGKKSLRGQKRRKEAKISPKSKEEFALMTCVIFLVTVVIEIFSGIYIYHISLLRYCIKQLHTLYTAATVINYVYHTHQHY